MGTFEVFYRQKGFIVIRFSSDEDCNRILKQGPYTFNSCIIIFKQWKMGMNLTRDYFTSIPIWIRFHNMNLELWTKDAICRISLTLGKPNKMDTNTAKELRLQYACVLVEIEHGFNYPETIKGVLSNGSTTIINVSYEYKTKPCENCHVYGHSTKNCCVFLQQKWKPKDDTTTTQSIFSYDKKKIHSDVNKKSGKNVSSTVTDDK